jgi:hypothetical protein
MKTLGLLLALLCFPLPAGELFRDGFESGDVGAWSSASGIVAPCVVFWPVREVVTLPCERSFIVVSGAGRLDMPSAARHLGYEVIVFSSAGVVLAGRDDDLICIGERCRPAVRLQPSEHLLIAFPRFEPHGTEALAWHGERVP